MNDEHHEAPDVTPRDGGETREPESFEAAMGELEAIVQDLERGELPLDASVAAFQRGTGLVQYLTKQLDAAEKRVRVLMEGSGETLEERDLDEEAS